MKDKILDYINLDMKIVLVIFFAVVILAYFQFIWNYIGREFNPPKIGVKIIMFIGLSIMIPFIFMGFDPMRGD